MQAKIFHLTSWAKTARGTSLEMYKKSHTSNSKERPYLFVGGVHGDEPEGVRLAQDFLSWLQQMEATESEKIHPWILIPCLNPDGYQHNQRTNSQGVDLNRNFPSRDWSTDSKGPRYYPGPSPGSENEVRALVHLIEDEKPQLIVHFHSWEPCVVYTGQPGRIYADLITSGTAYQAREDVGYPTPGSLGQYGWLEKQIPVICIEEQEHIDLNLVWEHFGPGLQRLMRRVST